MGRRGPKPTPAYLKILRGNPGGHELDDGSPRAIAKMPACPRKYWKTTGTKYWKALGKKLSDAGILSHLDVLALELLVDSQLAYDAAMRSADEKLQADCYRRLRQMLREFGLTPASRCNVKRVEQPEKEAKPDPAAQYFA